MSVLTDPNVERVYLVTLRPGDGAGGELVYYLASAPVVTEPTDTPANTVFVPALASPITYRRAAYRGSQLGGRSIPQHGAVEVINTGEFDHWFGLDWVGRPITVDVMARGASIGTAERIFSGVADDLSYTRNGISIPLRDKQHILDGPAQANQYATTVEVVENRGRPIPLAFGQVRNVPARLVSSGANRYQVHDGAVSAITTVYDNGQSVSFTPELATGAFTLSSSASGFVTADVQGSNAGVGGYVSTVADIIRRLVTVWGPLSDPGDLDVAAFDALNVAAPYICGLYLADPRNRLDVLDALVQSVGGFYGFDRQGKFTVGQIVAPELVSPIAAYGVNDVLEDSLTRPRGIRARWRQCVYYQRNYTVQNQISGVSDTRQAFLAEAYRVACATDETIQDNLADPDDPDPVPTLLDAEVDATVEGERWLAIYGQRRDLFSFRLMTQGFQRELGEVVTLTYDRFGLDGGRQVQVIDVVEDGKTNQTTLTVFG